MASALLLAVVVGVLAVVLPSVFAKDDEAEEYPESDTRLVERRRSSRVDRWSAVASRALGSADPAGGEVVAGARERVPADERVLEDPVDVDIEVEQRAELDDELDADGDQERLPSLADRVRSVRAALPVLPGLPAIGSLPRLPRFSLPTPWSGGADQSSDRRRRRVQRRRRTLILLVGVTVGTFLLGFASAALVWVSAVSLVATVLFVSHLRREAQRDARWRARSRRQGQRPLAPQGEALRDGSGRSHRSRLGDDTWEPVPVPEPTYVRMAREAEAAELTSRTLLSWRAAEIDAALADEDVDPVEETVAMFDQFEGRRRAVGEW